MNDANGNDAEEARKEYLRHLFGKDWPLATDKIKLALERAHAIREFEIELYWKRSTYFWGFQIVLFAGFGLLVQGSVKAESVSASDTTSIWLIVLLCSLSYFATIFSILWRFMISGAKFWQDNWERHIDALEDSVTGPLYKTYFVSKEKPNDWRPFSVTKINNLIVNMTILLWIFFLLGNCTFLLIKSSITLNGFILGDYVFGIVLVSAVAGLTAVIFLADSARMDHLGKKLTKVHGGTHSVFSRKFLFKQ